VTQRLGRNASRGCIVVSTIFSRPILRDGADAPPQDEVVRLGDTLRSSWRRGAQAPSPDDASHRRENHERPYAGDDNGTSGCLKIESGSARVEPVLQKENARGERAFSVVDLGVVGSSTYPRGDFGGLVKSLVNSFETPL
jgi:hypothetical protein